MIVWIVTLTGMLGDPLFGFSDSTGFLLSGTHDPTLDAGFFPPRYDLALIKDVCPGQERLLNPGQPVCYRIYVMNQVMCLLGSIR